MTVTLATIAALLLVGVVLAERDVMRLRHELEQADRRANTQHALATLIRDTLDSGGLILAVEADEYDVIIERCTKDGELPPVERFRREHQWN